MRKIAVFGMVLIISVFFAACENSVSLTLNGIRSELEQTGNYEIFGYYAPADHDYPVMENTVGGFSFHAITDYAEISSAVSAMVMEFKNAAYAEDYARYINTDKIFWITIRNDKFFVTATKQNEYLNSSEISFLNNLLIAKPSQEQQTSSQGEKIFAVIFLLVFGLVFFAVGFFGIKSNKRLIKVCTSLTTGEVVEIQRRRSGGKRPTTMYYPVFSYTAKGVEYTNCSTTGMSTCKFTEGQKVTMYVNPDNPDEFYVEKYGISNGFYAVFLVIGLLVMAGGPLLLFL
ncbi:MAG: DUF3592 domain-containing protein [Treponema sp.]|nr:DUF3592 domain-containing protein [Treponema sp.]